MSSTTSSPFTEGRHRVHVAHLVMGLVFLCLTAVWGLVQTDVVTGSDIRWLLPLPWLVAGAAGLAAATASSLRRTPPTPPPSPTASSTDLTEEQS